MPEKNNHRDTEVTEIDEPEMIDVLIVSIEGEDSDKIFKADDYAAIVSKLIDYFKSDLAPGELEITIRNDEMTIDEFWLCRSWTKPRIKTI